MITLSLEEAYHVLKRFKYVVHEDGPANLKTSLNDDGLIVKIKSYSESVMLFPFEYNESVILSEDSITLNDGNNWKQIFKPLVLAKFN
jgi:hypothetical protein